MPTVAPFPTDPVLIGISIAYRNQAYIADMVLPRVNIGVMEEFKYWVFPEAETFRLPDTRVGRKSKPNEVDLTATETTSKTNDYGLDEPIPQTDIDNAPVNHSPVDNATTQLTEFIVLDREKRAADLVFAAANYPTGYKTQLSGTSQWSDFTNSDPIDDIMTALDAPLIRPNVMTLGQEVWTKLSTHPNINKAIHGTSGDTGVVRRQAVADLFELEEVLVGVSRRNTAKHGQTATLSRVWGKHCSLTYRDRNANARGGLTFGFTAERKSRRAGQRADPNIGAEGGQVVRVWESVKELIVANQAGYFIEDAVQ